MKQLADALIKAGIVNKYSQSEKPKGTHHMEFVFPVTKFEIPIFIKVECEEQRQGLKFISSHALNSIPGNITIEEAKKLVEEKLDKWFWEPVSTDKNGMLRYWKFL